MTLWLTRPSAQSKSISDALYHPTIIAPVQRIQHLDVAIDGTYDAVITTSQHACVGITQFHDLPLYTVGETSAEAARKAGFSLAVAFAQDAVGMVAMIVTAHAQPMRFLYLAGRETRVDIKALLESRGHSVTQVITYEAITESALSPALVTAWNAGDITGVVFMSVGAVHAAIQLMNAHEMDLNHCMNAYAFCLSAQIAAAAGALPWLEIRVSESPVQQSLIQAIDATISA